MAPRAFWKGYLKLSLVSCPIALYPVISKSQRPKSHRIHKRTGQRLRQQMVEPETFGPVEPQDIVRGFEVPRDLEVQAPPRKTPRLVKSAGVEVAEAPAFATHRSRRHQVVAEPHYVEVKEEELRAIEVTNTHSIDIQHFVPRLEIDDRYLNASYYAVPTGKVGEEAFAVIRDAMKEREVAGLAYIVLSRREYPLMLQPFGQGLLAVTLHYPYEVRDAEDYFETITNVRLPKEMKQLALHIVDKMAGHFDASQIEDRYKSALDALLAAKSKTRPEMSARALPSETRVVNLMDALKASLKSKESKSTKAQRSQS